MPATPPSVVLLDVNETLTDLSPLGERFTGVGLAATQVPTWFAGTLRDGFALTAAGQCPAFADVARGVLLELLAGAGVEEEARNSAADAVLAAVSDLDLHPDVPEGLRLLAEAQVRAVPFTNGAMAASDGAFRRAGVEHLLAARLSVAEAGVWKPAAGSYRWAADRLGVPVTACALVAVHPWDLDGASRAGLRAGWLDRRGAPWPPAFLPPDVRGATLPEVVRALLG